MKIKSIRRTLLLSINGALLLLLAITALSAYYLPHYEMDDLFDEQLAQYARFVRAVLPGTESTAETLIQLSSEEAQPWDIDTPDAYESHIEVQVWRAAGEAWLSSLPPETRPLLPLQSGYHQVNYGGEAWVGYSLYAGELDAWIFTVQRQQVRQQLGRHLVMDQLLPLLLAILPIMGLVWLSIYWGTRPVQVLSDRLAATDPGNLQPLDVDLPRELQPFQAAVNHLFAQLSVYVKQEKMFIANASHELRTPLSVLRVHTENLKQSVNLGQARAAAQAIQMSTKRLSHLVNQLMEMEKLEHTRLGNKQWLMLQPLVADALESLGGGLLGRVSWSMSIPREARVLVEPVLCQVALRNLLENAGKYAPVHTEVRVQVEMTGTGICLQVSNDVAPAEGLSLERMGERFFRHHQHQGIEGAGLGLAITRKILELHQAGLFFSRDGQGRFVASVHFAATASRLE